MSNKSKTELNYTKQVDKKDVLMVDSNDELGSKPPHAPWRPSDLAWALILEEGTEGHKRD